jgi:hypothetical protein
LYSDGFSFFGVSFTAYGDCGQFDPTACPAPIAFTSISTCVFKDRFASFLATARKPKSHLKMRGVRVVRTMADRVPYTMVFTGGAVVVMGDLFSEVGAKATTFREQLDLVRQLRVVGATDASANLLPMLTPRFAIRKARKISRVVRRTGSVRQAAKRLGAKPRFIRTNLAFGRNARWFGPIRPVNCPREADFLDAFDSGAVRSSGAGGGRDVVATEPWQALPGELLR